MAPRPTTDTSPYIPPDRSLPEITVKAVALGIVLSMVLGAANIYLGLKAGMTVAASIPAAVISMGVLRLFNRSNILENNIVQTAASAGESLAAGVIFTLPALVFLGVWDQFNYWQTTVIAALGGVIGVLFTIPLRRALIVSSDLAFPEGLATAEVLKVGDTGGGVLTLLAGGVAGALFKLGASGLKIFVDTAQFAWRAGSSIGYVGVNLAPALIGVGYIVGLNIAVLVFLGGAINWLVAIPLLAVGREIPADSTALDFAWSLWSDQTRYIGVGAMLLGGLWALIRIARPIVAGVRASLAAYHHARRHDGPVAPRTERDIPVNWLAGALAVCAVPVFFVFHAIVGLWWIAAIMTGFMLVAGFLFSALAAYMGGLVGSSNNPVSGVTIATLLTAALLLLALGLTGQSGPAAAILIGAVVCCAAAIGGDNMQDLKAGQLVGATPWKQQIMQIIGVLAGAAVMAPVLSLLLQVYGIGSIHGSEGPPLDAPQASLMAAVAKGVFARHLPWAMVGIGIAIAAGVIVLDLVLEKRRAAFRTPVLAVAVGLYLPLYLGTALLAGGIIATIARRLRRRRTPAAPLADIAGPEPAATELSGDSSGHHGLLFAAGLITGEALLGIGLAVPIAINQGANPLDLHLAAPPVWPGMLLMAVVAMILLVIATGKSRPNRPS